MSIESEYPVVTDCFSLEKQIQLLKYDIDYYRKRGMGTHAGNREKILKVRQELFLIRGCLMAVEQKRQFDTKTIFDKFADQAKIRIEGDSVSTRNVYVGISAVIIALTIFIITKNK